MNVLSVCDGMSCGQIALERAGIPVTQYFSFEVDAYAIAVTQRNYPGTVQLGTLTSWREWSTDWSGVDLILAGTPCQGFSSSGSQQGFSDPRSRLFFEFVALLNHIQKCNPDVKFLFENVKMKQEYINVINRELGVEPLLINSALVSAQRRERNYWCNWNIKQPQDLGLSLVDIIENGMVDRDKSYCIDANYYKGSDAENYLTKSRRQLVFLKQFGATQTKAEYQQLYGRKLISSTTDSAISETIHLREHALLTERISYRLLTPFECERLQTVPEGYTEAVSKTQRYKMLGNGWTVDVITGLLKQGPFL